MPLTDVPPNPPTIRTPCRFGTFLAGLDDASRDVLQGWLDDENWSATNILRELKRQNMPFPGGDYSLLRHRRKDCRCSQ